MSRQRLAWIFTLIALLVMTGCTPDKSPQMLKVGAEVKIPQGYELLGVAQYGQITASTTMYCRQKDVDRYFVCEDGKIVREVVVPAGYILVDVTAYGKISGTYTFYCQNVDNKKYYICNPS